MPRAPPRGFSSPGHVAASPVPVPPQARAPNGCPIILDVGQLDPDDRHVAPGRHNLDPALLFTTGRDFCSDLRKALRLIILGKFWVGGWSAHSGYPDPNCPRTGADRIIADRFRTPY